MSLFLHYLSLPYLLQGIEVTLEVTALGLGGGLILGLILAWMQLSRFWWLSAFARGYAVIFRGTPKRLNCIAARINPIISPLIRPRPVTCKVTAIPSSRYGRLR